MTDRMENGLRPEEHDDHEHRPILEKTGYFGRRGAGAIIMARSTGRVAIGLRSQEVLESGTWGTFGGAIPSGVGVEESVRREIEEECGATQIDELIPLFVFEDENVGFRYDNFLAVVPDEFEPRLNWEHEEIRWFDVGDWPDLLHFGLKAILEDEAGRNVLREHADIFAIHSPGMKT